MRQLSRMLIAVAAVVVAFSSNADPAAAIGQARQAINARDYQTAVKTLQGAVAEASALAEPHRTQALSAIHFYSALALSAMKNDAQARQELERFFALAPSMNTLDPAKFDKRFITAFNEVRASMDPGSGASFASVYPAYKTFAATPAQERPWPHFANGPELTLLATAEEKQTFKQISGEEATKKFIDEFWSRRDAAFRDEFLRRVAFADEIFPERDLRGSLTDRGRSFVLLGAPKLVRQANLTASEAARGISTGTRSGTAVETGGTLDARSRAAATAMAGRVAAQPDATPVPKGKVERWVYSRDQLPSRIPDDQLVLKFITEEGYGENVLQREPLVVKALHDAAPAPH